MVNTLINVLKLNMYVYITVNKRFDDKIRIVYNGNELVDTVDLGRAILADPAFCEAVLNNSPFVKCFNCSRCQYGPGTPHKCPALAKRMNA